MKNNFQISKLVYESFSEFYKIYGLKKNVLSKIKKQLFDTSGELSNFFFKKKNKKIVGVLFYYDFKKFKSKSLYSTIKISSKVNKLKKIEKFSKMVQQKTINCSMYISRIAIDKNFSGKGYGSYLIKKLEDYSKKSNYNNLILHVNIENLNAINFYKKNGFKFYKNKQKYKYQIMLKKI